MKVSAFRPSHGLSDDRTEYVAHGEYTPSPASPGHAADPLRHGRALA